MIKKKIYNIFKKLDLDNPLEFARTILAPLCKEKLNYNIANCKDCKTCCDFKRKEAIGNPNANILIIDDNATDDKAIDDYTMNIIEAAGLSLKDVFIVNSISCILKRTFHGEEIIRNATHKESKNCKYFVDHAIDFVKPRVIIIMGASGLAMYNKDVTLEQVVGSYIEVKGIKTMVTYSAKGLFTMLENMEEDEVNDIAENVLTHVASAAHYVDNLERR